MNTQDQSTSPAEVFGEWQRSRGENDQAGTARVVDIDGYTEISLGLTEWTTGYDVAANLYQHDRAVERHVARQ